MISEVYMEQKYKKNWKLHGQINKTAIRSTPPFLAMGLGQDINGITLLDTILVLDN